MNDQRLVSVLSRAGFRGEALKTAFGIAKRESGGRNDAFNPDTSTGDQSYGLFQINMLGSLGPARRRQFGLSRNEDLFDPVRNAKAAFRMSNGGRDFGAWGIGPNAYRSGAGYDTISRYVSAFPGGQRPLHVGSKAQSKFQLPDFGIEKALDDDFKLSDFDVGDILDGGGDLLSPMPSLDRELGLDPMPSFARERPAAARPLPGKQRRYGNDVKPLSGPGIALPTSFRSTHMTSGLGWPAIDIMGKPGTPVRTPVSGVVEYFHPEGAQGGGSMMLRGNNGRKYWLGHVAQGVTGPVQAGQPIAVIANQSVSAPHAHWAEQR